MHIYQKWKSAMSRTFPLPSTLPAAGDNKYLSGVPVYITCYARHAHFSTYLEEGEERPQIRTSLGPGPSASRDFAVRGPTELSTRRSTHSRLLWNIIYHYLDRYRWSIPSCKTSKIKRRDLPGFGMAPAIKVSDERAQQVDARSRARDTQSPSTLLYRCIRDRWFKVSGGERPRGRTDTFAKLTRLGERWFVSVCGENSRPPITCLCEISPQGAYSSGVQVQRYAMRYLGSSSRIRSVSYIYGRWG